MTGTSCDALDIAIVQCSGEGEQLESQCQSFHSFPLGELGQEFRSFSEGKALTAKEICKLNHNFGDFHIKSLKSLEQTFDLISLHGQTVYHAPPLSWQMLNLSQIAGAMMTPIIGDLRGLDLALGGQGAPITPLADLHFYGSMTENRAVVNLGGFCNITILPQGKKREHVQGYDLCAANQLLDKLAQHHLDIPLDTDGAMAASGRPITERVQHWLNWLKSQYQTGRSLGQNNWPPLGKVLKTKDAHNELASACLALALNLTEHWNSKHLERILYAGGGWNHRHLFQLIDEHSRIPIAPCDPYGPSSQAREAAAIAHLGALCWDQQAITLPQVTDLPQQTISFTSGLRIDPR
jgi:1,6-anhydro-N-acetylmuramate kinase